MSSPRAAAAKRKKISPFVRAPVSHGMVGTSSNFSMSGETHCLRRWWPTATSWGNTAHRPGSLPGWRGPQIELGIPVPPKQQRVAARSWAFCPPLAESQGGQGAPCATDRGPPVRGSVWSPGRVLGPSGDGRAGQANRARPAAPSEAEQVRDPAWVHFRSARSTLGPRV
jgi:hypothetical protein